MEWLYALLAVAVAMVVGVLYAASSADGGLGQLHNTLRRNFRPAISLPVLIVALGVVPYATSSVMSNWGRAQKIAGYKQWYNGTLVQANKLDNSCSETSQEDSGDCSHTYTCDPYLYEESYPVQVYDYTDKDGNAHYHTETRYRWVTHHHQCPYATDEYSYNVVASYGHGKFVTYPLANDIFAAKPIKWRNDDYALPTKADVARGDPPRWTHASNSLKAGYPDGVTMISLYDNPVLASQDAALRRYSPDVDFYLAKGWLPEHTAGFLKNRAVYDDWNADKMSFVGFTPSNKAAWELSLMRFNSALGMELQGDMHIVAIQDKLVPSGESERYANALMAYWQGPKMGKKALAKNGIMLVLGVNANGTIAWSRSQTGMPVGNNGAMLEALSGDLLGKPFDPKVLLGSVKAEPISGKDGSITVKFTHSKGLVEHIVFEEFPFARACVACKDKTDHGTSLTYLSAEVKIPTWATVVNILVSLIAGAFAVGIMILTSPDYKRYLNSPYGQSNRYDDFDRSELDDLYGSSSRLRRQRRHGRYRN